MADPFQLIPSALGFAGGALQSIFGGGAARRAQRELERLETPKYMGSRPITDYYQEALGRYNVSPYQSAAYNQTTQGIDRNTANILSSATDRRGALATVDSIAAAANDAQNKAVVDAEVEKGRRFSQLGSATEMKSGDERMQFQINKLLPYQKKAQLLSMKAASGAATANSGLSNMFGALAGAGTLLGSKDTNLPGGGNAPTNVTTPSIPSTFSGASSLFGKGNFAARANAPQPNIPIPLDDFNKRAMYRAKMPYSYTWRAFTGQKPF